MAQPATARTRGRPSPPLPASPEVGSARWTAAIARGDSEAFASFYEIWFDRAFAMARSISRRDESFCLDVVQDCMMKVVRSMKPLADEAAVRAWMGRTVLTTTIDRLRADRRRARREEAIAADAEPIPAMAGPAGIAERREEVAWLRQRLAELPERDQQLLLERYADDKTLEAVGAALGITGHAAHGRIWRLLQRLRRAAGEWFHD